MESLLIVLIAIVVLGFLLDTILEILNIYNRKKPLPSIISDVYLPDKYELQQRYEAETTRFELIQKSISLLGTIAILAFGLFGKLHHWIEVYSLHPVLVTLVFFGVIGLIMTLLSLPFSVYSTFVIEEKYGFNRTTPRLFVTDLTKSLLITILIGGSLLALITWVFYLAPNWFWVIALVVLLSFSLLANALYSRVIVPLFNKQKPLDEGDLLNLIKDFAQKVGFPINKVFVIDGSKRSTKANAYFTGFGKNRRVVLYDTLIEKMSNDEILAVLAHEIGHFRKRHVWINMALGAAQMTLFLYVFNLLSSNPQVPAALGYVKSVEPIFHLSLIGFAILFSPIESIIGLFTNWLSRRMEYQADGYAGKYGMAEPLISGLKKLSAENLSNLTPHPAYVFVNYSHPTLLQRILALTKVGEK